MNLASTPYVLCESCKKVQARHVCERCGKVVCDSHVQQFRGTRSFYALCADCRVGAHDAMTAAVDRFVRVKS